jgi:hypothetical protein
MTTVLIDVHRHFLPTCGCHWHVVCPCSVAVQTSAISSRLLRHSMIIWNAPATFIDVSSWHRCFVYNGRFPHFLPLLTVVTVLWEVLWSAGWLFGECDGGMRNNVVLLCVLICRSTMLDLTICCSLGQIPHSMISSFVVAGCSTWIQFKSKF